MSDDKLDDIFVKCDELDTLFGAPLRRAAYSDRTAHLMACMAQAAYYAFEGKPGITDWVSELVKNNGQALTREKAKLVLEAFAKDIREDTVSSREAFAKGLALGGFELLEIYDVPETETQGYLARRMTDDPNDAMLVLAFRGTERHKLKDWLSDLNAKLVTPLHGRPGEKVHAGFYNAYRSIEEKLQADLEKHKGPPLYIAGHSLGGALAVLATRFTAKDSLGACYTFGGPRVANSKLSDIMFTPIYRIVNAADLVARVPPSAPTVQFLAWLLDALSFFVPTLRTVAIWLRRDFGEFTHFGDMRYLNYVTDPSSPDLLVVANPSSFQLMWWTYRRVIRLKAGAGLMQIFRNAFAGIQDHDMSTYRKKLRQFAIRRAQIARQEKEEGIRLNSVSPAPIAPPGKI